MTDPKDPSLESQAKRLLDQSTLDLDDAVAARLRAARARAWQRAETEPQMPAPRLRPRGWLPLGGLALAGVAAATAGLLWFTTPAGIPTNGFEDIELLAAKDGPDFYAELEFYRWLASRVDAT